MNAVRTTGIYCRAGCAGRPIAANTIRMRSPVEAEAAGYRPCLRCRSDRLPLVSISGDTDPVVAAALVRIGDGFLDRHGEDVLGREVGVSARHLRRLFAEAIGATPSQVASSRRAHFARALLDETDLSATEIAYASGFGSVRSMNDVVRATFRATPTELRRRRRSGDRSAVDGGLHLTLRAHRPLDVDAVMAALAAAAIPRVESVQDHVYRRSTVVCGHPAVVEISLADPHTVAVIAHLPAVTGLIDEIARVRRLLRLDQIGRSWRPGPWTEFEHAVRRLIAAHVGDAAGNVLGRLARWGAPIDGTSALDVERVFPTPRQLLRVGPDDVDGIDGRTHEALVAISKNATCD